MQGFAAGGSKRRANLWLRQRQLAQARHTGLADALENLGPRRHARRPRQPRVRIQGRTEKAWEMKARETRVCCGKAHLSVQRMGLELADGPQLLQLPLLARAWPRGHRPSAWGRRTANARERVSRGRWRTRVIRRTHRARALSTVRSLGEWASVKPASAWVRFTAADAVRGVRPRSHASACGPHDAGSAVSRAHPVGLSLPRARTHTLMPAAGGACAGV